MWKREWWDPYAPLDKERVALELSSKEHGLEYFRSWAKMTPDQRAAQEARSAADKSRLAVLKDEQRAIEQKAKLEANVWLTGALKALPVLLLRG